MSANNVRILPGNGDRHPLAMLEAAKNREMDDVLIIGTDGCDMWFCCSTDEGSSILWMLENAKRALLNLSAE